MAQKEVVKRAIETILNDVIDRGFKHLMHFPQSDTSLNVILRKASEEMSRLKWQLENHKAKSESELDRHFKEVSDDLQKTGLALLSELQEIEKSDKRNNTVPKGEF